MFKRINGIQHIGVAVHDMDASLRFYRNFFGMDVPFFDSVAAAPLMKIYTRDEVITKRASMICNLQGGCAMEVIRPTSFEPTDMHFELRMGDLGITHTFIKSTDVAASHAFCEANAAPGLSALSNLPTGQPTFTLKDPDGNIFQYIPYPSKYTDSGHHSLGAAGCSIGVSDMDTALGLYRDVLGYDQVIFDQTGTFEDWSGLPGGEQQYRRVFLTQSQQPGGGFAKVTGKSYVELVYALDRKGRKIYEDRQWADPGFVHLGYDVRGMKALGEDLAAKGYGFTCDSNDALDMGKTKVHCVYIEDRDGTLLELIEVYKVPIVEKWGLFLNVEKRDPLKPLPDFMLKALRFSRIRD